MVCNSTTENVNMPISKFFKDAIIWKNIGGARSVGIATFTDGTGTALIKPNGTTVSIGNAALGPYATVAALQTAFPASSNLSSVASIGSAAPYATYVSNGSAWILMETLTFFTVSTSTASLTLNAGKNKIVITYNGNVTVTLTAQYDCEYDVVYASGSTGTATVVRV